MNRLDALKELTAKVEAGELPDDNHIANVLDMFCPLDAALALHEAVLPGWFWARQGFVMTVTDDYNAYSTLTPEVGAAFGGSTGWGSLPHFSTRHDTISARAWLLAILRALIAQEDSK